MCSVNVLLSTYNGEKYIEALIKSVLNQKCVDVILTIRDDGSTDRTVEIIKEISDKRIVLIEDGQKLYAAKSFLHLLKQAGKADYYAYCDQDDIWMENKLEHATKCINEKGEMAVLYMSTYDVVDENLEFLYKRDMEYEKELRLESTILCRTPSGCTMVFNNQLAELINQSTPEHIRMHDFWTLLVALANKATIMTEDISLIKYRIHGNNTVGLEKNYLNRIKRLFKSALHNKNERMLQVKSLYDEYNEILDEDVKKLLMEVIEYKKNIRNKIVLLRDKRFRWNTYTNLMFYISVITGVF